MIAIKTFPFIFVNTNLIILTSKFILKSLTNQIRCWKFKNFTKFAIL